MSSNIFSCLYILFCRSPWHAVAALSDPYRPNEPIFFLIHMLSFTLLQADSSRHAVAALRARRYRLAVKQRVLRHSIVAAYTTIVVEALFSRKANCQEQAALNKVASKHIKQSSRRSAHG